MKNMNETESPSLSLNIEHMRAKVALKMVHAMLPFLEEFKELDAVEKILKQQVEIASPREPRTKRPYSRRKKAVVVQKIQGPYSDTTQSEAILTILTKEPGLEAFGISERLRKGGFPFKTRNPLASMYPALRQLVLKRKLRALLPTREERIKGINIRYYLMDADIPKTTTSITPSKTLKKGHTGLADAVRQVVQEGPKAGMSRKEVLQVLLQRGFPFNPKAEAKPELHVTWALKALVNSKKIAKSGMGTGAMFSAK